MVGEIERFLRPSGIAATTRSLSEAVRELDREDAGKPSRPESEDEPAEDGPPRERGYFSLYSLRKGVRDIGRAKKGIT